MLTNEFKGIFALVIILACALRVSAEPIKGVSITDRPNLPFCQSGKLLANDGAAGDRFASSVSVSGDVALVGVPGDGDNGWHSGSAYVFRWKGTAWVLEQKLLADDGVDGDFFGASVSISGDVALVGSNGDNDKGEGSGSAYVFRRNGMAWVQEQKLLADDGADGDAFGDSVSVSGDVALVGAREDDDKGEGSGSVYVFRWSGAAWVQEQKLLAGDGAGSHRFGRSVSLSGDVALIGAPLHSGNRLYSGSAYVFRWNGKAWVQEQRLLAGDGADYDLFGVSVSASGDVALVGANGDDDNGEGSGSVYVFRRNGMAWVQEQKLLADDGVDGDFFGASVSISGDVALVGAKEDNDNGTGSGSAYVFFSGESDCNQNGVDDRCDFANGISWDQNGDGLPDICTDFCELPRLLADDGSDRDGFGSSVSVCGDVALVGARDDNDNGAYSGSAYVFRWNGVAWMQEQKLLPDDGAAGDFFGASVSISGDVALIGASRTDRRTDSGSAYVFRWNGTTWVQEQELLPDDGAGGDRFGSSVSISGDVVLVGAREDDDNGAESGSAYVFRWDGTTWVQEQKLLADDGAAGAWFGASVSISGVVALIGAWPPVYVFRWNGSAWVQEQKLLADDGAYENPFGTPVSVFNDVALVGEAWDNDNGTKSGSAYVFRWNGSAWVREQKLLADDRAGGDEFGRSVSVFGDVALVGAAWDDDNGTDSGSAYLFRWNGSAWLQEQKLLADNGAAFDELGRSASLSGDVALIGAWGDDDNGTESGSAAVFSIGVTDCNRNGVFDACDIRTGTSRDCNNNSIPDACEIPQTGAVVSNWVGESGVWDNPPESRAWCLPETPDNNLDATFDVTIANANARVTLNTSPTVSTLTLVDDATISVSDDSGANVRTLAVDRTMTNSGVFRATDRERLTLDAPVIDQGSVCGAGGVLEATNGIASAGEENDKSILEINGAVVLGGIAQTIGDNAEIHLIGGAELVDVCVDGVVVPDGQTGAFSGTLQNNNVLAIRGESLDTRLEPTAANAVLASEAGIGCVRLTSQDHARLGDFKAAFTNSAGHRIEGAGIVLGGVQNEGVIEANHPQGEHLIFFPPGEKANHGVISATGNGVLRIADHVQQGSGGRIEASEGGVVRVLADVLGTGGLVARGGTVHIDTATASFGFCVDVPPPSGLSPSLIEITGSTVSATTGGASNDLFIRGGTVSVSEASTVTFAGPVKICPEPGFPAALDLSDSTFSAGTLHVCEDGQITAADSTLSVVSGLRFDNKDESDWTRLGASALEMTGGVGLPDDDPTGFAPLEIGGEDLGIDHVNHVGDPSGILGNFSVPKLIIGLGAHVTLFDRIDNGNRVNHGFGTDEALYVDELVFADAGGRLNTNGVHLYYNTLAGDPSQVIDLPRPQGDYTADGDVDLEDIGHHQICFGEGTSDHGCRVFDYDEDDRIGHADTATFNADVSGPM